MSLRRTFIAAKGVAVAFDSGSATLWLARPANAGDAAKTSPCRTIKQAMMPDDDHLPWRA